MTQAVSRRPLNADALFQFRVIFYVTGGEKLEMGRVFLEYFASLFIIIIPPTSASHSFSRL